MRRSIPSPKEIYFFEGRGPSVLSLHYYKRWVPVTQKTKSLNPIILLTNCEKHYAVLWLFSNRVMFSPNFSLWLINFMRKFAFSNSFLSYVWGFLTCSLKGEPCHTFCTIFLQSTEFLFLRDMAVQQTRCQSFLWGKVALKPEFTICQESLVSKGKYQ